MATDHHSVTTAAVVLDIGGDIGAAIVRASRTLEGRELEIRPVGSEWNGHHVAFHPREAAAGPTTAAIFPDLARGDWEVRLRGVKDSRPVPLRVVGGQVTTVPFPSESQ